MTTLDYFVSRDWEKKSPVTEDAGTYFIDDKFTNNVADFQTFDLQKFKSGEYLHRTGALEFAPANDVLMAASLLPEPQSLWGDGLIFENEVTCLYSDSNTGKSILSVQIGNDIAKTGRKVLYVDFELSMAQFRKRYKNERGEDFEFSPNFLRCNSCQYAIFDEDTIISDILSACADSGAEVVIIDNLTWIDSNVEKGDAAALLMKELVAMKQTHGLTVIVISHTPKRDLYRPITQNDLSGSKKIMNFVDAAITIGKCLNEPNLRYIKQIKVRSDSFKYDSDNVLVCELNRGEKENYLHFEPIRTAPETELLRSMTDETRDSLIHQVKHLTDLGRSQREIARELGISKSCVLNYQRKNDENNS